MIYDIIKYDAIFKTSTQDECHLPYQEQAKLEYTDFALRILLHFEYLQYTNKVHEHETLRNTRLENV